VRRFVLDASVLLSAVLAKPDSYPSLLLDAVLADEIEMVLCEQHISEVTAGLESRYFRDRITAEERYAVPAMLEALGIIAPDPVARRASSGIRPMTTRRARASDTRRGDHHRRTRLLEHHGLAPPALSARLACEQLGLRREPPAP
jgi:PIN domain-containing protein